ncbi:hypothetical protein Q7P35_009712 [Cladosporium inversicolor]
MPLKPRTIVNMISALYLLILTTLAAYALHRNDYLSLPIPNILGALCIALPPLAGVALETTISLIATANRASSKPLALTTTNNNRNRLSPTRATQVQQTVFALLLIYETAIATLAGTYLQAPECGLREKWQGMFHAKDSQGIRAIQEALQCCGFGSTKDMAWPFPGQGRGPGECVARAEGAVVRCLDGLRGEERRVGWMLLAVPVGVFVWKCLVLALPTSGSRSRLPSGIQLPGDGEQNGHRRIEFRDAEEAGEEDSIIDEVRRLNNDSQLASTVEGTRTRPSVLLPRDNTWASDP